MPLSCTDCLLYGYNRDHTAQSQGELSTLSRSRWTFRDDHCIFWSFVQGSLCSETSAFLTGSPVGSLWSPLLAKPVFSQEIHSSHQDQESETNPKEILGSVIPEGKIWDQNSDHWWAHMNTSSPSFPFSDHNPFQVPSFWPYIPQLLAYLSGIPSLWLTRRVSKSLQIIRKMEKWGKEMVWVGLFHHSLSPWIHPMTFYCFSRFPPYTPGPSGFIWQVEWRSQKADEPEEEVSTRTNKCVFVPGISSTWASILLVKSIDIISSSHTVKFSLTIFFMVLSELP